MTRMVLSDVQWALIEPHCPGKKSVQAVSAATPECSWRRCYGLPAPVPPYQARGRLFKESQAHLGFKTQRQWSDLATERTTPWLLGLYSIVALLAHGLYRAGPVSTPTRLAGNVQRRLGSGALPSVGG